MSHPNLAIDHAARVHIAQCAAIGSTYAGFKRVALTAMLSARRSFDIVGDAVADTERDGAGSRWLSAPQRRGVDYLNATEGQDLHARLMRARELTQSPRVITAAMMCALDVPALGLAKAGFTLQMLGFDVGCIDTHNVTRYNVKPPRLDKTARELTRARHTLAYVRLCRSLGGSVELWASWCAYMSDLYPDTYASPVDVSARHVQYCEGVPF